MSTPATDPGATRGRSKSAVVCAGWLLDGEEEGVRAVVDDVTVERIVARLRTDAQACAHTGAVYLPALLPRKREVVLGANPAARRLAMELRGRLRDVDAVELLDLLPVLRDACRHGSPYHRTDADWNDRGAFFAARAVLKEAHKRVPELQPPGLSELWLCPVEGYRGTLAGAPQWELAGAPQLERADEELMECSYEVEPEPGVAIDAGRMTALRMPVEEHLAAAGPAQVRLYRTPASGEQAMRVAVVGEDDATIALVRWLAERADKTTWFKSRELPQAQLEVERPRLVVQLLREAHLIAGA